MLGLMSIKTKLGGKKRKKEKTHFIFALSYELAIVYYVFVEVKNTWSLTPTTVQVLSTEIMIVGTISW